MVRLVTPVAAFISCLLLTGQMADRIEIIALKSAGVPVRRLLIPYLMFAVTLASALWYLDGWILPASNKSRFEFEQRYLNTSVKKTPNRNVFRQESMNTIAKIGFIDANGKEVYNTEFYVFDGNKLNRLNKTYQMDWVDTSKVWYINTFETFNYDSAGYAYGKTYDVDTLFNIRPADLQRSSTDVYQLSYPEIVDYLETAKRSGIEGLRLPFVQFYGKLSYPLSIIVSMLIGLAIASKKIRGGRGVHLAVGLGTSFFYLATLKIAEPFGISGQISPELAAILPHAFFLLVGLSLMIFYRQ
jgi:lipopolysaccharide export system permease protein